MCIFTVHRTSDPECIPKWAWSWPPIASSQSTSSCALSASPTSLHHRLQVHLWTFWITASMRISQFTRHWDPSACPSSPDYGLDFHMLTTSSGIFTFKQSVSPCASPIALEYHLQSDCLFFNILIDLYRLYMSYDNIVKLLLIGDCKTPMWNSDKYDSINVLLEWDPKNYHCENTAPSIKSHADLAQNSQSLSWPPAHVCRHFRSS